MRLESHAANEQRYVDNIWLFALSSLLPCVGSFTCFGVAMEGVASKCANAGRLFCPAALWIT